MNQYLIAEIVKRLKLRISELMHTWKLQIILSTKDNTQIFETFPGEMKSKNKRGKQTRKCINRSKYSGETGL